MCLTALSGPSGCELLEDRSEHLSQQEEDPEGGGVRRPWVRDVEVTLCLLLPLLPPFFSLFRFIRLVFNRM